MAGVEAPSVDNVMSLCCRHEKTHTPVVLGGTADVICVGAVWSPTRADGKVFVNKAFVPRGAVGVLLKLKFR